MYDKLTPTIFDHTINVIICLKMEISSWFLNMNKKRRIIMTFSNLFVFIWHWPYYLKAEILYYLWNTIHSNLKYKNKSSKKR